ncbi:MAG: hypothetical protein LZF60_380028 [Nitrospira sp.]|nr:MAG: hypothetical protein LZF60_380028 [Nitrospira sp.]
MCFTALPSAAQHSSGGTAPAVIGGKAGIHSGSGGQGQGQAGQRQSGQGQPSSGKQGSGGSESSFYGLHICRFWSRRAGVSSPAKPRGSDRRRKEDSCPYSKK